MGDKFHISYYTTALYNLLHLSLSNINAQIDWNSLNMRLAPRLKVAELLGIKQEGDPMMLIHLYAILEAM